MIIYKTNQSTFNDIYIHLLSCDKLFLPPLSDRVDIKEYSEKIVKKATRIEAWSGDVLCGLLATYMNDEHAESYITNLSVLGDFGGMGIGDSLLKRGINLSRDKKYNKINLEVFLNNEKAVTLYKKRGFKMSKKGSFKNKMTLSLNEKQ